MLLLFLWILKLHLFDLLLQVQRKQKWHIGFHLIHFFFHFKFHCKVYSQDFILDQNLFLKQIILDLLVPVLSVKLNPLILLATLMVVSNAYSITKHWECWLNLGLSCFCLECSNYPTGGVWGIIPFWLKPLLQSRTSLAWAPSLSKQYLYSHYVLNLCLCLTYALMQLHTHHTLNSKCELVLSPFRATPTLPLRYLVQYEVQYFAKFQYNQKWQ